MSSIEPTQRRGPNTCCGRPWHLRVHHASPAVQGGRRTPPRGPPRPEPHTCTREDARPRRGGAQSPKDVTPVAGPPSPCPCPRRWPPGCPPSSRPRSVPGPPAGPRDIPWAASSRRARLPAGCSPARRRGSRCGDGGVRGTPAPSQPLTLPVSTERSSTSPQLRIAPAQRQTGAPGSLGRPHT